MELCKAVGVHLLHHCDLDELYPPSLTTSSCCLVKKMLCFPFAFKGMIGSASKNHFHLAALQSWSIRKLDNLLFRIINSLRPDTSSTGCEASHRGLNSKYPRVPSTG
ncbi:hypothetical protein AAY473_022347 [Plecturocebus cupreus]